MNLQVKHVFLFRSWVFTTLTKAREGYNPHPLRLVGYFGWNREDEGFLRISLSVDRTLTVNPLKDRYRTPYRRGITLLRFRSRHLFRMVLCLEFYSMTANPGL